MKLPELMTIEAIASVSSEMTALLKKKQPVPIDFSAVEDIDLSGIQCLVALFREATREKIPLTFTGSLSVKVADRFSACGFALQSANSCQDLLNSFGNLT